YRNFHFVAAPTITADPANASVSPGGSASFTVSASSPAEAIGPLRYQWRFNGVDINGATSATLTINNAQMSDVGSYDVVVSNSGGSTASAAATLTLLTVTPPSVQGGTAVKSGNSFSAAFATQAGTTYEVVYKNSLGDPTWTLLQSINGDGTVKTFTDVNASGAT